MPADSKKAFEVPVTQPRNPYVVLALAMVLPGTGQLMNGTPFRGLFFVFFMLVGAFLCFHTTTPEHSNLGRYAGGWFVYAISILDAYKWAKYRFEYFRLNGNSADV